MKHLVRNTLVAGISLLAVSVPQSGEASPQRMESVSQTLPEYCSRLNAAEEVLRSKDQQEWSSQELENYLQMAMFVVYSDVLLYVDTHKQTPQSSRVLREQGFSEVWPGNPLNNWEPISWEGDGFIPGNLVLQECPPELYSGLWNPRPMSFIMSINGTSESYEPLNEILYGMPDWAELPAGTAFAVGAGSTPHTETRRNYEEHKAK